MNNFLTRLRRRWEQTVGSSAPWVVVFGAIALGFITDGLLRLVEGWWQADDLTLAGIMLLVGVVGLLLVILFFDLPLWVSNWARWVQGQFQVDIEELQPVPPRRGVIAIVSLGQHVPAEAALAYHAQFDPSAGGLPYLRRGWLLVGPGEGELSSATNAAKLRETFEARGVAIDLYPLNHADDMAEIFGAVKKIIRRAQVEYGFAKEEIIADFTGGTKSMTAALTLACIDTGIDLQYMKPDDYELDGRAKPGTQATPHLLDITFLENR